METKHNYRAYRECIGNQKLPAVPYLGITSSTQILDIKWERE
jgi:hypothetical protein